MKICFATHNKHKVKEIQHLLNPKLEIITLDDLEFYEDIEETKDTYYGNASLKANTIYDKFGYPTFADDSGLEVKSLGNEPGVFSARYSGAKDDGGKKNRELLLKNLEDKEDRSAQFVTVIAFFYGEKKISHNPHKVHKNYFQGILKGTISYELKGKKGFAYDSIFIPDFINKDGTLQKNIENLTLAELDLDSKNKISSRSIAFKELVNFIIQNTDKF